MIDVRNLDDSVSSLEVAVWARVVILPRPRPRHPVKELDKILQDAFDQGWRVDRGKKYFKLRCPCEAKHLKTVHLTPSDPHYERNLRGYLRGRTCWKDDVP